MPENDVSISVIVPFYHGNAFLGSLFQSLEDAVRLLQKEQPERQAELVLVNDSPDEAVILPEGAFSFAVNEVVMPENSGIHAARIAGVRASSGAYLLFLDQDDRISERFFLSQIEVIGDFGAAVSNYEIERADGTLLKGYRKRKELTRLNRKSEYLYAYNVIKSPGQCLLKRTALPEEWLNESLRKNGADDLLLWVLYLERGQRFALNKECLYVHAYTGRNLSESEKDMGRSALEAAKVLKNVPYIPAKDVRTLERSRTFRLESRNAGGLKRIGLAFRFADVVVMRAVYKLEVILSGKLSE